MLLTKTVYFQIIPSDIMGKNRPIPEKFSYFPDILKYHIVPGTYYQKGLPPGFVRTMYLSYLKISEGIGKPSRMFAQGIQPTSP